MSTDVVVLREILQRELETINAYEAMLCRVKDPKLREIIAHVTDDEREHVAEMYHLIMAYDPKQQERAAPVPEHLAQFLGEAPTGLMQKSPPPAPALLSADQTWSVGSLKNKQDTPTKDQP